MAEDILDIAADGNNDPKPKLKESDRVRLDGIVAKMQKNKESEEYIKFVVDDFKKKYATIQEPTVARLDISKLPQYSGTEDVFAQEAQSGAITKPKTRKLVEKAITAQQGFLSQLDAHPDVAEAMIRRARFEKSAQETPTPISDQPRMSYQQTADRLIQPEVQPKDMPVTPEEIQRVQQYNKNTESGARGFLSEVIKRKPEEAPKIQQTIYDVDAFNSIANDPEGEARVDKVNKNSDDIAKGKLIYDVQSGRLVRPEGMVKSFLTGWKEKTKSFEDYDFLKNTENDAAIASQLDFERTNRDPDEALPVPKNKLGELGQMLGYTPAKAIAGGAIASALGTPQAGVIAGSVIGGREMAKLEYANTFKTIYYELIDKDVDKFEAVRTARSQAEQAAEVGAVVGAASGAIGARWGIRPLPKVALTGGLKQAAVSVLRKEGSEFSKILLEGLAAGGIGAAGEGYKNALAQAAGIDRDITEGMAEQIEGNLLFAAALGAAAKAGKGMNPKGYRTLLNALKRTDEVTLNNALQEMAQQGHITPLEAEVAVAEVNTYKQIDDKIPVNVSEDARIQIQDKIKKRDDLEARIEKEDKAFHPEVKEKIKVLEEEINTLAKDKEKVSPEDKRRTRVIQSAINEGKLTGPYKDVALGDPEVLYRELADQIFGQNADGSKSIRPDAEVEMRTQFGDELVDDVMKEYQADESPVVNENTDFFNDIGELYDANGVKYIIRNPKSAHGDYVIQRRDGSGITITIGQDELVKRVNNGDLFLEKPIKIEQDATPIRSDEGQISQGGDDLRSGTVEVGSDIQRIAEEEAIAPEVEQPAGQQVEGEIKGEEVVAPDLEEPLMTGISHARMNEMSRRLGFSEYQEGPETFKQWDEQADKILRENPRAIPELMQKMREGGMPSATEQIIMARYVADLDAKLMKDPKNDVLINELKRAKDISNIAGGRFVGQSLVARKHILPIEETLGDFYEKQQEASKVGTLTEQQKETNIREFEEIKVAEKAYQDKIQKLEEENAQLRLEQEIKKQSTSKGVRKTKEEYSKERKDILANIKKKWDESKGQASATLVPYAEQLVKISPDVAKLIKSLVEEGIDNLPALVSAVHAELKSVIDGITERDAQDLIAGRYNEKQVSRNDLAAQLRDLKDEAKYLSKLEDLEAGIKPTTESQRKKRNQRIEELKQKIKSHELTQEHMAEAKAANPLSDADKIKAAKNRINKEIKDIESQLTTGKFATKERVSTPLDAEGIELKDKLIRLRKERDIRLAQDELDARKTWQKYADYAMIPIRELRTIWSSFDLSMPARQGLIPTAAELLTNPGKTLARGSEMVTAARSEKFFDRFMFDLKNSPEYKLMEDSEVSFSDPNNFNKKEEVFQSRYVEKLPVIGTYGIKGSERAAAFWLNSQRRDLFLRGAKLMEDKGMTFQNSSDAYKQWGKIVNTLTGKGELIGELKNASGLLSTVFFSPKLMASRLAMLNPRFYTKIPKPIRKMFYADLAKFIGLGTAILGTAKLFGADVEPDPRHSDFGKIKVGDTRWDIWGGLQQYVRLASQLLSMSKKTKGGDVVSLWEKGKEGERPAPSVLATFLRSKSSPVLGTAWDVLSGENIVGEDVTWKSELNKLWPIMVRDMLEATQQEGAVGVLKNLPALIGVGVQTYDDSSKGSSKTSDKKQINRRTKND